MTVKHPYDSASPATPITLTDSPEMLGGMADRGRKAMSADAAKNVRAVMNGLLKNKRFKSRAELGRAVGVTGQSISQILKEITGPSWETARELATIIKVDLKDLLAGSLGADVASAPFDARAPEVSAATASTAGDVEHMAEMLRLRALPSARYPRLEYALGFFAHEPARWSPYVIDLAQRGQFEAHGCAGWTSPQWAEALDKFEAHLKAKLELPLPLPPRPPTRPSKPTRRS